MHFILCTANIYLCRAFSSGARQTYIFVMHFPKTHDKVFLKFLTFVLLVISPLQEHYFVLYISIFIHVSINLLYLPIMCHLDNFCRTHQI
jgi:hypothetical protein